MKVIIVGCGRVGARLALQLDGEGHNVSVVDERVAAFSRLGSAFGGQMIVGNGVDELVLRKAGIETADCFASLTNGDNRNIMAAEIARSVFKVKRVITRVYDPIREAAFRDMGLETVCPTVIGTDVVRRYFEDGINRSHPAETAAAPAEGAPA